MNLTLNEKLIIIGIRLTPSLRLKKEPRELVDIERTLIEAMLKFSEDARLVSLILSWIKVHGAYVIVEKLSKFISHVPQNQYPNIKWVSLLAAFAIKNGFHKWKKLIQKFKIPQYLFPEKLTKSAINLKGSIDWLKKINIIIPNGAIRIREEDILTPLELIKRNQQYKNRYLYGASWRADIITAIEYGCKSPTEIMCLIGCSYEPAYRIFQEFSLATS